MVEEEKQAGRHIAPHPLMYFLVFKKKKKQAGIQGQWEPEFPTREYLEQVKYCHDTDCTERVMKKGFHRPEKVETGKNTKNTFRKHVKASEWAFDRIKEAFEQVAQHEAEQDEHCARDHD